MEVRIKEIDGMDGFLHAVQVRRGDGWTTLQEFKTRAKAYNYMVAARREELPKTSMQDMAG